MMTETEELTLRRDTLAQELEKARRDVAAREAERKTVLGALEAERDERLNAVGELQREVDELEGELLELEEEWETASREAAGAKAYLKALARERR